MSENSNPFVAAWYLLCGFVAAAFGLVLAACLIVITLAIEALPLAIGLYLLWKVFG